MMNQLITWLNDESINNMAEWWIN